MKNRIRAFAFVLLLGVVLPGLMLRILSLREQPTKKPEISKSESGALKAMISVIYSDGYIREIPLEKYVLSVVLAEMPAEFGEEALKAQAVLARTYALKRQRTAEKHDGAVCTDSACCQGYCDPGAYAGGISMLQKVRHAVAETKGEILVYENQLIEATYFSCSGGRTEDSVAVWGNDLPYLQSTDSPGEEESNHYISTVKLEAKEVMDKLGLKSDQFAVSEITYTEGGGVSKICICENIFTGVQVRQLLNLKSTAFRISILGDHVFITTKGYGHRVGMSQYGANAMAKNGSTYEEILSHYYKDTELSEIA